MGVRVRYMHSDIDAIERMEIVRGLRLGEFDVLVGINLLREGLDLPEVSLVAILDADQEGFLRSDRSLIQTVGRAARHVSGRAIFYADRITGSMQRCIDETSRRREIQRRVQRGARHHAASVSKSVDQVRFITRVADARDARGARDDKARRVAEPAATYASGWIAAALIAGAREGRCEKPRPRSTSRRPRGCATSCSSFVQSARRASARGPEDSRRITGATLIRASGPSRHPTARGVGASRRCSEAELTAWGEASWPRRTAPLVIAIAGELGAGKTTLAQAICRGYGVTGDVTSSDVRTRPASTTARDVAGVSPRSVPTRIAATSSPTSAGTRSCATHALVLVEWPERAGARVARSDAAPSSSSIIRTDPSRRLLLARMSDLTLVLDASTYAGTVALVRAARCSASRSWSMRDPRHERLMPAVAATLAASRRVGDLTRIVCGAGPGSFTSLRIAASIAKGLAVASGKPLFAVPSLALLVAGTETALPEGRWLAILDAMRGESFAAGVRGRLIGSHQRDLGGARNARGGSSRPLSGDATRRPLGRAGKWTRRRTHAGFAPWLPPVASVPGGSRDLGAGLRAPRGGAGAVGGGARPRAGRAVMLTGGGSVSAQRVREQPGDDSIAIDAASRSDIDAVADLELVAFADPWTRQAFEAALKERHARFRVARSADGGLLGYVVAWFVLDEGEIANLAVVPTVRRRGVARALLEAIVAEARESRISRLFLEVRESNVAAKALYESQGFSPIARRERYYRKPVEDAIVLRLDL